jgi:hypothetical protein
MFCWTPEPPVVHFDNGNLSDNIASNKKKYIYLRCNMYWGESIKKLRLGDTVCLSFSGTTSTTIVSYTHNKRMKDYFGIT